MIRGKLSHVIGNMRSIGSIESINIPYILYVPRVPTFTIEEFMYLKTTVFTFK